MRTWVFMKPMFYGLVFSWRKVEKHKRFPWIMRWIMLPKQDLTGNSKISTSATQFIWRQCFPYVYVSLCEANVLWLGIFLEEDREKKRFPWIMRWIMLPKQDLTENSMVSTSATQFIWRLCFPYADVSPCEAHVLWLGIFFQEDQEIQKIPLNYAPGVASDAKFHVKYLRYSVYLMPMFPICVRESL